MKIHTTNYKNTFIEVAVNCPTKLAEISPVKGEKITVANIQFDMVKECITTKTKRWQYLQYTMENMIIFPKINH